MDNRESARKKNIYLNQIEREWRKKNASLLHTVMLTERKKNKAEREWMLTEVHNGSFNYSIAKERAKIKSILTN
jgi:hypothetical protein